MNERTIHFIKDIDLPKEAYCLYLNKDNPSESLIIDEDLQNAKKFIFYVETLDSLFDLMNAFESAHGLKVYYKRYLLEEIDTSEFGICYVNIDDEQIFCSA